MYMLEFLHAAFAAPVPAVPLPTAAQTTFKTTPGLEPVETLRATTPRAAQTPHKKGVQPAHCGIPGAVDAAPIEYHGPLQHFKAAQLRPDLPRSAGAM